MLWRALKETNAMKKIILILVSILLLAPAVYAHCPLCTGAVGAAAIGAKYYGLDESIIGIFIGAFSISTGLWIGRKIKKEYIRFQLPLIVILSFLLTVIPLLAVSKEPVYLPVLIAGASGSLLNKVYWVNKILLGSIIGTFITLFGYWLHLFIKRINGKVLFPFQGITLTIFLLAISSMGVYFFTRYR